LLLLICLRWQKRKEKKEKKRKNKKKKGKFTIDEQREKSSRAKKYRQVELTRYFSISGFIGVFFFA